MNGRTKIRSSGKLQLSTIWLIWSETSTSYMHIPSKCFNKMFWLWNIEFWIYKWKKKHLGAGRDLGLPNPLITVRVLFLKLFRLAFVSKRNWRYCWKHVFSNLDLLFSSDKYTYLHFDWWKRLYQSRKYDFGGIKILPQKRRAD